MCFPRNKATTPAGAILAPAPAAANNKPATDAGTVAAALRKRRAGAAADILTSPVGIPATPTMGGVS